MVCLLTFGLLRSLRSHSADYNLAALSSPGFDEAIPQEGQLFFRHQRPGIRNDRPGSLALQVDQIRHLIHLFHARFRPLCPTPRMAHPPRPNPAGCRGRQHRPTSGPLRDDQIRTRDIPRVAASPRVGALPRRFRRIFGSVFVATGIEL